MILNELFNTVVPYRFEERDYAKFSIGDKHYFVQFAEGFEERSTEVVFGLGSGDDAFGVKGTGDEILVFSTVLRIMKEYVNRENVLKLTLSASLDEPSRVKLYDRMVRTLAGSWHVQAYSSGNEKHYVLTSHQAQAASQSADDHEDVPF